MIYTPTGNPGNKSPGASATIRAEFALIAAAMALLPDAATIGAGALVASNGSGFVAATAINGLPIGSTTPSTGAFTTLSATGSVTLGDATSDTFTVGGSDIVKNAQGGTGFGAAAGAGYRVDVQGTLRVVGGESEFTGYGIRMLNASALSGASFTVPPGAFSGLAVSSDAGPTRFFTGGVDRMVVSGAGLVRIGNVGVGDITGLLNLRIDTGDGPLLVLTNKAVNGALHKFGALIFEPYRDVASPVYGAAIWSDGSSAAGYSADLVFGTSSNLTAGTFPPERFRINSAGAAIFQGAVTAPSFNGLLANNAISQFFNDANYVTSVGAAAAVSLTGSTLAGNVTASSLTSVGILSGLALSGGITTSAQEALRIANSTGYIAFHNSSNGARTGYIQFNAGGPLLISAENPATQGISLTTGGGFFVIAQSGAITASSAITAQGFATAGTVSSNVLSVAGAATVGSLGTAGNISAATLGVSGAASVGDGSTVAGESIGFRGIPPTVGFAPGKCNVITGAITLGTAVLGNTYGIYNESNAAVAINQGGGLTLRKSGTTSTGNFTLAPRGYATLWYRSGSEAILMGSIT